MKSVTIYDLVVHLGTISVVAVNDFQGQNLPVLRLQLDNSDLRAGGAWDLGDFTGEVGRCNIISATYTVNTPDQHTLVTHLSNTP